MPPVRPSLGASTGFYVSSHRSETSSSSNQSKTARTSSTHKERHQNNASPKMKHQEATHPKHAEADRLMREYRRDMMRHIKQATNMVASSAEPDTPQITPLGRGGGIASPGMISPFDLLEKDEYFSSTILTPQSDDCKK